MTSTPRDSGTAASSAGTPRVVNAEADDTVGSHTDNPPNPPKTPWKEDVFGDDRVANRRNVSWGAIFAGVVTFLALTILLSLITAGIGLGMADLNSSSPGEGVGTTTGILSVIVLALAMLGGGYVAGVLAGKAGLMHGFVTWATSLIAAVVLVGMLAGSILGAAGGMLNSALSTAADAVTQNPQAAASAAPNVNPSEAADQASQAAEQAGQAVESAAPQAEQAAQGASAGAWWTFAGLLIGAILASVAGMFGSRSVLKDDGRARRR